MNRHALLIAAVASAALMTAPTQAADFGWNSGGGAASPIYSGTSVFNWSGFYAGVNAGYGWGTLTTEPAGGGIEREENSSGLNGGIQAGYNMDMGGFVVGAEADINLSNIGYSEDIPGVGSFTNDVDAFGTLRGRAGMAFGTVMPYVTGGLAWGRGSSSIEGDDDVITSQSKNHIGWTAGVGLEAAATDNITFRAEYLYVDLGEQTYSISPTGSVDAAQRFGMVRAGINYKF